MAPSTVTSLTALAQALLAQAEAATATTTGGTPPISIITATTPTWDCCPMLAVHVQGLTEESTSPLAPASASGQRASFGRMNLATLIVTIVRCAAQVHEDGSVDSTALEAVAAQVQEDGWSMWNTLYHAIQNEVFGDLCSDIHFDYGRPIEEQGGCVGWQFQIRALIEGIPNPGAGT